MRLLPLREWCRRRAIRTDETAEARQVFASGFRGVLFADEGKGNSAASVRDSSSRLPSDRIENVAGEWLHVDRDADAAFGATELRDELVGDTGIACVNHHGGVGIGRRERIGAVDTLSSSASGQAQ